MPKATTPTVPTSQIIRDCSNGSQDYFLPTAQAKRLCQEGKLFWDLTNGAYSHWPASYVARFSPEAGA